VVVLLLVDGDGGDAAALGGVDVGDGGGGVVAEGSVVDACGAATLEVQPRHFQSRACAPQPGMLLLADQQPSCGSLPACVPAG
jgi:hypothetical protein